MFIAANVPKRTDQLGSSYSSLNAELEGSPPLWITHITGTYHDDIYVNNARILVRESNIIGKNNGKEQVRCEGKSNLKRIKNASCNC